MRIVVSVILFPVLLVFMNVCMLAWGMAFIPAFISAVCAVFIVVLKQRRRSHVTIFILSAVVWFLYGLWEMEMYYWSQTVDIPIRIDLVFLFPVLYAASIAALFVPIGPRRQQERETTDGDTGRKGSETASSINHFILYHVMKFNCITKQNSI